MNLIKCTKYWILRDIFQFEIGMWRNMFFVLCVQWLGEVDVLPLWRYCPHMHKIQIFKALRNVRISFSKVQRHSSCVLLNFLRSWCSYGSQMGYHYHLFFFLFQLTLTPFSLSSVLGKRDTEKHYPYWIHTLIL